MLRARIFLLDCNLITDREGYRFRCVRETKGGRANESPPAGRAAGPENLQNFPFFKSVI